MTILSNLIKSVFDYAGYTIISERLYLLGLTQNTSFSNWISLQNELAGKELSTEEESFLKFCTVNLSKSKSQILQDLFVLWATENQNSGMYLEFGAADGILHSNTYLLENEYKWSGLLIEPHPKAFKKLNRNRKNSLLIEAAVDPTFSQISSHGVLRDADQISGLDGFLGNDSHLSRREIAKGIKVKLINLHNALTQYKIGKLDYISIDTEGSEAEIVKHFDWEKYSPKVITIETNGNQEFEIEIESKMKFLGYKLFSRQISRWDLWFYR